MATGTGSVRLDRRILGWIDRLSSAIAIIAAAALILLAANVFFDVLGRWIFNQPIRGTLEVTANWWMPTLTLLAFAHTERMQEHIKVTILLDALPLRLRRGIEGLFSLIATALLVTFAYYTGVDAFESAGHGEITASSPAIAIWPFKFVAVAGVSALALQMAATSYRYFAGLLPTGHDTQTDADLV